MTAKSILAGLALTTALTAPAVAMAKPVSLTINMNSYGGQGAYLAVYVTGPDGNYLGSLWMAGGRAKYYKHLSDWAQFTGNNSAAVDGITGASVGSGSSLTIDKDLSDKLFDAGYTLHIDAAVEDMRDSPNEVEIPLTSDVAGQAVAGGRYISDVTIAF